MPVDNLWYRANRAEQRAEQAYHRLREGYDGFIELDRHRRVSRRRFRTLLERIERNAAPYGAQTLVHSADGRLLLVRHDGVERWVLPGGGVEEGEGYSEAARRELREEAGIAARYDGLAMVTRLRFEHAGHSAWGLLPVFEARPESETLEVRDPDDEISAARWFALDALPEATRDRRAIDAWRARG